MLTPEIIKNVIAHLESELAKLPEEKKEEPKLRHGDYKVTKDGRIQFFVGDDSNGPIRLCQECYMFPGPVNNWAIISDENIVDSGNFLDDLAAMQEDVTKFEFKRDGNPPLISVRIFSSGLSIGGREFNIANAEEYILKLRQLVATAKRKQLCKESKK